MATDAQSVLLCERSLARCETHGGFLDRFYQIFLASSEEVRKAFAHTEFAHQKELVRVSLHRMLEVAREPNRAAPLLFSLAERHSRLGIGAALYDDWLDSLLAAVRECDPACTPEVERAWELSMMTGIRYMLLHF